MSSVVAEFNPSIPRWVIRNRHLKCTAEVSAEGLIWRLDRLGPQGETKVVSSGAPDRGSGRAKGHITNLRDGSKVLAVSQAQGGRGLVLTRFFQVFPDQPFLRLWAELKNESRSTVPVNARDILNVQGPVAGMSVLFHVEQFSWSYRRDFFQQHQVWLRPGRSPLAIHMGGHPSFHSAPTSCGWVAVRGGNSDDSDGVPNKGKGFVVGIEFNGKSTFRAGAASDTARLVSSIDDLHHRLTPGQMFEVPACFLGLFDGDWDEAADVTHRFAERYVHPPRPDGRFPWVQYDSWGYGQDIDEKQQLEAVRRCADMGVEAVVLDLGWAVQIGEWRHNPQKFPHGLRPLARLCRKRGMRFGVHLPIAQANVDSPVGRKHPDWLISTDVDYFGAVPICLGHDPCRKWITAEIIRMIDDYEVEYIVQDGEDMVKPCASRGHTHAAGDSNYANSTLGLDAVIQEVHRRRPHVVLENCEDGGAMLTYRMGRLYHTSVGVDNMSTYATRQGVYGMSYPFSPRYSARYVQDAPTLYTLRSSIFGGPLILMQKITEWTRSQMKTTRDMIAEYKALRPLVQEGKVIHLLPPACRAGGDGWDWDAIQTVSRKRDRSVALVFRAKGGPSKRAVRVRGLKPDASYIVAVAGKGKRRAPGKVLMEQGIKLTLKETSSARIDMVVARDA